MTRLDCTLVMDESRYRSAQLRVRPGRIRVVLHAASSAPSTDWVARLCDVHHDGRSIILADGITRVMTGADAIVHRSSNCP